MNPPPSPPPPPSEITEAEAAITKADWKTAETKLEPWLASHPSDARALFDAGYVADAQNRLDTAAGFYRRAVDADPKSFESHVSLGLLLARQASCPKRVPNWPQPLNSIPVQLGQP